MGILKAALCANGVGGIDSGDRVRERGESAAGASRRTTTRNSGETQRGRRTSCYSVRQLLTESALLASFGGTFGVLFAILGVRFLTLLLGNGQANFTLHAELNWHVLSVAIALSLLTGVLFGLAPAMRSTHVDVISAMKETRAGRPGTATRGVWRISLGHVPVVAQIALSLLMLVAAGLFVRTLTNLESIEVGFNRLENLLLFELDARKNAGHKIQRFAVFYSDLQKQFSAIPGVRDVSLSNQSLIEAGYAHSLVIHGKPDAAADRMLLIGPGFFRTMEIPIFRPGH